MPDLQNLTQLSAAGILVILVLRLVFDFLREKKNGHMDETNTLLREMISLQRLIVSMLEDRRT